MQSNVNTSNRAAPTVTVRSTGGVVNGGNKIGYMSSAAVAVRHSANSTQGRKIRRLKCMYTKHVTKKRKVWSDGIVKVFYSGGAYHCSLIDAGNLRENSLGCRQLEPPEVAKLKKGEEVDLEFENYLINVPSIVAEEKLTAGFAPPLKLGKFMAPSRLAPSTNQSEYHPGMGRANAYTNEQHGAGMAGAGINGSKRGKYQVFADELDDIWDCERESEPIVHTTSATISHSSTNRSAGTAISSGSTLPPSINVPLATVTRHGHGSSRDEGITGSSGVVSRPRDSSSSSSSSSSALPQQEYIADNNKLTHSHAQQQQAPLRRRQQQPPPPTQSYEDRYGIVSSSSSSSSSRTFFQHSDDMNIGNGNQHVYTGDNAGGISTGDCNDGNHPENFHQKQQHQQIQERRRNASRDDIYPSVHNYEDAREPSYELPVYGPVDGDAYEEDLDSGGGGGVGGGKHHEEELYVRRASFVAAAAAAVSTTTTTTNSSGEQPTGSYTSRHHPAAAVDDGEHHMQLLEQSEDRVHINTGSSEYYYEGQGNTTRHDGTGFADNHNFNNEDEEDETPPQFDGHEPLPMSTKSTAVVPNTSFDDFNEGVIEDSIWDS